MQVYNWVELPVQRRLCPIFVKNVGSPNIHEYSAGGRVVNGPPGLGRHRLQNGLKSHISYMFFEILISIPLVRGSATINSMLMC